MLKPSKPFVVGCCTGFVLAIIALIIGIVGGTILFKDAIIKMSAGKLKAPPITSGLMADYDWTVTTPAGEPFEMTQLEGKPLFIHFWNPKCLPCLAELPGINHLYEQATLYDVAFACIAVGKNEEATEIVRDNGYTFPLYLHTGKRPEVFQGSSYPATYIIAPNGDIVFKHVGQAKWDDATVVNFLATIALVNEEVIEK